MHLRGFACASPGHAHVAIHDATTDFLHVRLECVGVKVVAVLFSTFDRPVGIGAMVDGMLDYHLGSMLIRQLGQLNSDFTVPNSCRSLLGHLTVRELDAVGMIGVKEHARTRLIESLRSVRVAWHAKDHADAERHRN